MKIEDLRSLSKEEINKLAQESKNYIYSKEGIEKIKFGIERAKKLAKELDTADIIDYNTMRILF